jgi:hypothetical protein
MVNSYVNSLIFREEDIAYRWNSKGGVVHPLTEGKRKMAEPLGVMPGKCWKGKGRLWPDKGRGLYHCYDNHGQDKEPAAPFQDESHFYHAARCQWPEGSPA